MNAIRHILFWSLPIVALLIVVRAQFVRVILGSGAFDWGDTRLTAAILALFALSLAAQALHLLLVRALYAAHDTRLPFVATLASSAVAVTAAVGFYALIMNNAWFATLLRSLMRLEDVQGIEVLALPLGYSCALILQVSLLIVSSRKKLFIHARSVALSLLRGLTAALVAGFCAYTTLNFYATGIEADTLLTVFLQGLFASLTGALGALFTYYLLKSPELTEAYTALHKRLFKTKTLGPQDEDQLAI